MSMPHSQSPRLKVLPYQLSLKHFILVASNSEDFEGQAYWRSLILAISQFSVLLRLLSSPIGATFKGKNMLPMGSIFFPIKVDV